jgi:hypothetical protein
MITNHLLKHLSIDIDESLYNDDEESEEAMKETVRLEFDARRQFDKLMSDNSLFQSYYNNIKDSEEKKIIKTLAIIHHFTGVMDKHQRGRIIHKQLDLCESFLASDMCHRDLLLKKRVEKEATKLKKALEGKNIVDMCARALNSFYKRKYPNLEKIDRAVKISAALRNTKIFKEEPFLTEEEAKDQAYRQGMTAEKAWKKIILQRLKNIID